MTGQLLVLLGYLLFMSSHGFSQAPARSDAAAPIDYETARLSKIVTAVRITEKITIDGLLEEPAWKDAIAATGFVQQQPFSGQPATKETEVRFLYDDDSLYASFICFDSEPTLVNDIREDYGFQETDGVSLVLDTLHDGRSGFTFGANPAGGHRDSQISDDSVFNNDWDGVFEVKVSTNSEGWIAEFRIPFKTVRFSNSPTQEWGVNLLRRIARNNESSYWAPIPVRYNAARVSLAGTLKGLENIHQGRNLKVKPFVTAGIAQSRPAGDPSGTLLTDRNSDGGVDVKYSLTPSLTLDTTYHTDFAQVEVDQQQVNLTRFSLFLAEKRDFFLENSGIFGFGSGNNATNLIPFFSRRIGLSDTGAPIPILGGARVSGQINRYDVGFLAMKTESQDSRASNNFWVGRIKRKILTNSWFGALATSRDSTTPGDTTTSMAPTRISNSVSFTWTIRLFEAKPREQSVRTRIESSGPDGAMTNCFSPPNTIRSNPTSIRKSDS